MEGGRDGGGRERRREGRGGGRGGEEGGEGRREGRGGGGGVEERGDVSVINKSTHFEPRSSIIGTLDWRTAYPMEGHVRGAIQPYLGG